jgi:hypothetical protein
VRTTSSVLALALTVALSALASSCSSHPSGTLSLLTEDATLFTRDPVPTTLSVETIDTTGKSTTRVRGPVSAGATIDLGDVPGSEIDTLRITALDAAGAVRIWGASLPLQLGALDGLTLDVFVQRTSELATLPGSASSAGDARERPRVANVGARYVLVAGGASAGAPGVTMATTELYDLGAWSDLSAPPTLPRAPRSMAVAALRVLLVDDGGATWFDLGTSTAADAPPPAGGAYAEVSGGDAVVAPDGTTYIVGGTRASGPTARVLRVSATGDLAFVTLGVARAGAAAGWIEGRGLVVAGGSDSGAGVEILAAGATAPAALPYPADPTTGAGLARLDDTHALLAFGRTPSGGDAGLRTLDLTCATTCASPDARPLPAALDAVTLFADASGILAVGDDAATGATRVFVTDANAAREIAVKTARNHARALRIPTGAFVLAGGATTLESFAF